jgi:hypothetical protein
LFPASYKKPQTAFTFEVLDHFHIEAMECKTSAGSFYAKLKRFTSNAFPDTIPVSDIFIICAFILTFFSLLGPIPGATESMLSMERLVKQKEICFGHDIDRQPGNGDLALFCPACPQPGINLPDNWRNHPNQ